MAFGPVIEFAVGEHVARLREGRHPAAVLEPRVPADMVGVQMRAHDKIDIVDAKSAGRQILLVAIGIHHVPKGARRPRLVVADAAVDHDGVVRRLHDVALDAEHQLVPRVEVFRLQPAAVLVQKLFGDGREEFHRLEKRTLLLDNAVDGGVADLDICGQEGLRFPYQSRALRDQVVDS